MISRIIYIAVVASIMGCSGDDSIGQKPQHRGAPAVSQKVVDAIAVCSSSIEISRQARAELEVELTKILEGQGSASVEAEVSQAVKGIAFKPEDFSNPNVVAAYKVYTGCINDRLGTA